MNHHTKRILHRVAPIAGLLIIGSLLLAVGWQALPLLSANTFRVAVGPGFGPGFPEPPSPIPADPGSGGAPLPTDPVPAEVLKPICQCPVVGGEEPLTVCGIPAHTCGAHNNKTECEQQKPLQAGIILCGRPKATGQDCTSQTIDVWQDNVCVWQEPSCVLPDRQSPIPIVCQEITIGTKTTKILSNECDSLLAKQPPSNPSIHAAMCAQDGCSDEVTYQIDKKKFPRIANMFPPEKNHYSCEPIMSTVQ